MTATILSNEYFLNVSAEVYNALDMPSIQESLKSTHHPCPCIALKSHCYIVLFIV